MKACTMRATLKSLGIDRLDAQERLALAEEIWESLEAEGAHLPLTEAQLAELERRLAEDETHPGNLVPWDQVKAETLARLRK